jgi:zinc metalloprotease ZmpB
MQESFDPELNAEVTQDSDGRVRAIRYTDEFAESDEDSPFAAAIAYVRQVAGVFDVGEQQLDNVHVQSTHLDPAQQGVEYRRAQASESFDAATFGFDQTYLNTPVWGGGISVTVKTGPNRIVQSVNTSQEGISASLPPEETLARLREIFRAAEVRLARRKAGDQPSAAEEDEGRALVLEVLQLSPERPELVRLIRGRFWIYQYDEAARLPEPHEEQIALELPPVDAKLEDGSYYLVAEITFEMPLGDREAITWRAMFEPETNSVLYLRALVSDLTGQVFSVDPPTKTAATSLRSASTSATLNTHRDSVTIANLDPPNAGTQSLRGSFGELIEVEGDVVAAPTKPAGTNFDFDSRTNDFAAVSAYFHVNRIFRTIADLGFTVTGPTGYFRHTVFPVDIDHRCFAGNIINAHCVGDGAGGIGHVGYGIMDSTDTTHPLGRACDPRVHWHELCGHGILYEYVDGPNFRFSHSAGDSLSGVFFDPESKLWGVDGTPLNKPGDLRFTYVPWHPNLNRRFDRDVAAGWAWGGANDEKGYGSEEILATTMFRVYRSIGGDSSDLARRQFASRMVMYLILRAVSTLTPATNPRYAREFAAALMAVDQLNWTSAGVFGGAYSKVIRWSFEKQGEYQSPLVVDGGPTAGTITAPGRPPDQDLYIDDGRAGEYQYQPVHWHTTTIWNRRASDGGTTHEEPALGQTNFAYVKIKNRGTQTANDVVVRGFHTRPGAGLLWPTDFEPFDTPELSGGSVAGNHSQETVVGPFEWTPNINAYGHDCMLMIVGAPGDASNVDTFTAGEVIPEWRLVPNDNNIGQRNVQPVPGAGGAKSLLKAFDGISIWVRNPDPRSARLTFAVRLPKFLARAGWKLELEGVGPKGILLKPGKLRRELHLLLREGEPFETDTVAEAGAARDADIRIEVRVAGNLVGGMTYRIDPKLERPFNARE